MAVAFFMFVHTAFSPSMAMMYADAVGLSNRCLLVVSQCPGFLVLFGFTNLTSIRYSGTFKATVI